MQIKRFEYVDQRTHWELKQTRFDPFNLLVGVSGVGKTKILRCLRRVCDMATGRSNAVGPAVWCVDFEHAGQEVRWEGQTDVVKARRRNKAVVVVIEGGTIEEPSEFVKERIVINGDDIVDRHDDTFKFKGQELPKLKKTDSAIILLENEERISPIRSAFRRVLFSIAPEVLGGLPSHTFSVEDVARRVDAYRALPKDPSGVAEFREKLAESGLTNLSEYANLAAYYLQEAFPNELEKIKALFRDIFPAVQELEVKRVSAPTGASSFVLELTIREEGVQLPISQSEISSGMLRTLVHLIEISLSPPGAVIVIDEFENSLGINCMPDLTRLMLSRTDCQFILTSHHPYVINNIPPATWKLVTRKGGTVAVKSTRDVPALQVPSHQQAFIRLINLPEYEEGVS